MAKEARVLFEEGSDRDLVVHLLRENEFEIVSGAGMPDGFILTVEDVHLVTGKEIEVLQALADYATLEAAARACHIEVCTLRTHEARLRKKFGVQSGRQLVAAAFRRGLIR